MSSFYRRLTATAVCAALAFGGVTIAMPANAAPVAPENNGIMVQPSNVTATVSAATRGTVTINWQIIHPSAIIGSYVITVYSDITNKVIATTKTTDILSRKAVFTGIADGTYHATVLPYSLQGVVGTESANAQFTIGSVAAPAAPTNLTISNVLDGTLTINWADAASTGANAPTAYRITYKDTVTNAEKTVDVTNNGTKSRQLKVLVAGNNYSVSVSAIKGSLRSAESNVATSIPGFPPKGPSAVTVANINDGYLTVNWTDAEMNAGDKPGSYRIYYTDTVTNVTKSVDVLNNGTGSKQIKVLNAGHPYSFKVSSIKRGTESVKKSAVGTKTPAYQNYAPSAVTASSATAGQMTVSWTDSHSNEEGKPTAYRITYTDTVTNVVKTVDVPNDGNKSRTLKTLVGGHAYSVTVAAIRTGGTSTATAAASNVTIKGGSGSSTPVASAPNAPTSAEVTSTRIQWLAATTGSQPTKFTVYYTDTATNETKSFDMPAVGNHYKNFADMTDLVAGHTYSFQVSAVNATGESTKTSSSTTHKVPAPAGAPYNAPTALTVTNPEDGTLTVSWTKPDLRAAGNYRITVTDTVTNEVTVIDAGDVSSKSLTGLTAGHAYTVSVTATGLGGASDKVDAAGTYTPTAPAGNGSGSGSTCVYNQFDPSTGQLSSSIVRPSAPTNVHVVTNPNDPTLLMVDWDAPTNWNGSDAFGYNYVVTDKLITDWTNPMEFSNHILMNSGAGTLLDTTIGSLEYVQTAVSSGMIQLQGQYGPQQPQMPSTPTDKTLYIYVISIRGTFPEVPSETNQPCLISNDLSTMTPVAYTFKAQLPGVMAGQIFDNEVNAIVEYTATQVPYYMPNQVAVPAGVTVSKIQARLVHQNFGLGYNWTGNPGMWLVDSPVFDVTRDSERYPGAKAVLPSDLLNYVPAGWTGRIQFRTVYSNGEVSAWGVPGGDTYVQ
jgi:hypothetical protein